MRILGLIGGISWVSTLDYYRLINEGINRRLGGVEAAECLLYSFNYADIKRNNDRNDWERTAEMLVRAGMILKSGGAEALVLCANTMHRLADTIEESTGLPVLHIAAATARVIREDGLRTVGLLGTRFTMEGDFFHRKLEAQSIQALIPEEEDRAFIHRCIFDELGTGICLPESKERLVCIIRNLKEKGAEGIILGCTELPLLLQPGDVDLPLYDTTRIHAEAAIQFALGERP
ncbi:MAG TPA: aspartate/glutamate racemase family protein [Chitinophagaceae bacterium]|jgi:aspartate racemase|nr:aspartate/glutamate racemase family protein [Chitinophagaceae bacterium]